MLFLAMEALLFLAGLVALHVHGVPLLFAALAMSLLYFVSRTLFRVAGVAGLFFIPWSVLLAP